MLEQLGAELQEKVRINLSNMGALPKLLTAAIELLQDFGTLVRSPRFSLEQMLSHLRVVLTALLSVDIPNGFGALVIQTDQV